MGLVSQAGPIFIVVMPLAVGHYFECQESSLKLRRLPIFIVVLPLTIGHYFECQVSSVRRLLAFAYLYSGLATHGLKC